jgi:hypothetical protein
MEDNMTADAAPPAPAPSRVVLWISRACSALVVALLLFSAVIKVSHAPAVVENMTRRYGFSPQLITPIGVLEALCALLYAIPRTAPLGAMLVTAYLGGATVTELRTGGPFLAPAVLGALGWLGLWLRDGRLRAFVLRR